MATKERSLLNKLLFRIDGAADSKKVKFTSAGGQEWQAEICLHSGTTPQSPRLMVMFRNQSRPLDRQRYTLVPTGYSKVPSEAAKQLTEEDLQKLLSSSVEV
ncbi:MAG: hypothetical protein Q8W45_03225 [Candidatus Palauibacterales bacterium]|nr:hypothetical protein [Candidatus Palauibacterales bacterium]MDP2482271.1 hypothetical protein [Candidatus Palauibacterales bacterium]